MTYDLHNAIGHATKDALTDLKRDGLDDLTNPHAQEIISEHAYNAVPMYDGQLINVYQNFRLDLIPYWYDLQQNMAGELDPFVNYGAIRYAVHRLIETRMLGT